MKIDKEQIKDLLERIRGSYMELASISPKFNKLGDSFEERHHSTIKNDLNELDFLSEEYNYVRTLVAKEHTEKERRETRQNVSTESAVDTELARYADRIEKYPEMNLHGGCEHSELIRLFGALSVIDREYWGSIEKFLRERYPIRAKSPMEALSNQFMRFIGAGMNNIPPSLTYYCDFVHRGELSKADDVAFTVTKDVAFFLNEVVTVLDREGFDHHSAAYQYITNVLEDFRLTEIKRR